MIEIPATTTAQLFATVSTLVNDLWVLIAVAIGVPLAFYVIRKVVGIMPKGR